MARKNGFVRQAVVFFVGWWLVWGPVLYRALAEVDGLQEMSGRYLSLSPEERRRESAQATKDIADFAVLELPRMKSY
jgi:hypothetical protein